MKLDQLKANVIVRGSIFPEPVQVLVVPWVVQLNSLGLELIPII
ncbi:MAG: hypothetical protein ACK4ZH_09300 [Dolichospermum sp.]